MPRLHHSVLTVGGRVFTFALLDGDIVDGDVSLDAGASDSLHHHLPQTAEILPETFTGM